MQNEEGKNMDLYIPRKCSATNRLITSKDHASVQINIGHLDANGRYNDQFSTFALCGFVRAQRLNQMLEYCSAIESSRLVFGPTGDADSALDRLWQKKKAELRQ
ncbi:40S ribosomal protein [Turnera subulata]|uniref:40S ribosomal protein n=1 Tax=Turnera subulata TaxID=218843 RepID=A0A9Q0JF46_9ROSI|nr:40S ribosomal protein [Turnera subulata]